MTESKEQGERLKEIRTYFKLTQFDFAQTLNITQAHLSAVENGKRSVSIEILNTIAKCYKEINCDWIITGRGDKLILASANTVQSRPNSPPSEPIPVDLIPVFSPQNSDFPRTHEDFNNSNILVPAKAYAGYSAGWPDDLEEGDIQAVVIPGIRGAARTVEVAGESMLPILEPGDWVVCRPIEHHREIKDGKIYVVVSSHYGLHIKYLHLYEKGINCISENRATHDSFILPFDDIREIWEVVMRITTHLRPAGAPVSAYESDRSRIRKIETWLSKNFPDFNQHLNEL